MAKRLLCCFGLMSCLLVGCAAEDTTRLTADPTDDDTNSAVATKASPLGTWTVSEVLFYGQASPEQVGERVTINEDGTAAWPRLGQTEAIEFSLLAQNPDGSIPFKTANSEDQPSAGGAGPRNGLLRILPSGEMEIIETTSAGEPVPSDFSEETQKNAIFLRLSRS